MSDTYTFTVFTATFNRAHTLHRVYDSLCRQTFRDFEWLIVDDGSTDGTGALAERWRQHVGFAVRYVRQSNRGKHVAFNHGVREARGRLFLPLDSDDACVPHALERFLEHWTSIPAAAIHRFTGVTALCMDETGRLVGRRFPRDVMDSDSLEMRYRFGITCEKWGFHRTEVLREYSFPETSPPGYLPESMVWSRIARKYRTRFVNDVLRVYYTDAPSLMRSGTPRRHAGSARLAELMVLNEQLDYFACAPLAVLRSAAQYVRLSTHAQIGRREQLRQIRTGFGRVLWALAFPAGMAAVVRDTRAGRRPTAPGDPGPDKSASLPARQ